MYKQLQTKEKRDRTNRDGLKPPLGALKCSPKQSGTGSKGETDCRCVESSNIYKCNRKINTINVENGAQVQKRGGKK